MLEVANLEVVYNEVVLVLRGLSIEVPDGHIVALLGANGAGKTTTLRAVGGLLDIHAGKVTKGSVSLDGEPIGHLGPAQRVRAGITQVLEFQDEPALEQDDRDPEVDDAEEALARAFGWIQPTPSGPSSAPQASSRTMPGSRSNRDTDCAMMPKASASATVSIATDSAICAFS